MTPYYEDTQTTLYYGDFREIMPEVMGECAVMLTDPPYGVAFSSSWKATCRGGGGRRNHGVTIQGDKDTSARDEALALWNGPALVFGNWRFPVTTAKACLVWNRTQRGAGMGDLSIPWKPNHEQIYVLGQGFHGHRGSGVLEYRRDQYRHPNEKPVALLLDLLRKCPEGTVLDPFAGSGSTLEAAKLDGRKSIGIEIEERWCALAADRLRQGVLFA